MTTITRTSRCELLRATEDGWTLCGAYATATDAVLTASQFGPGSYRIDKGDESPALCTLEVLGDGSTTVTEGCMVRRIDP